MLSGSLVGEAVIPVHPRGTYSPKVPVTGFVSISPLYSKTNLSKTQPVDGAKDNVNSLSDAPYNGANPDIVVDPLWGDILALSFHAATEKFKLISLVTVMVSAYVVSVA